MKTVQQDFDELMLAMKEPLEEGSKLRNILRDIFFAGAIALCHDHRNERVVEVADYANEWSARYDKENPPASGAAN